MHHSEVTKFPLIHLVQQGKTRQEMEEQLKKINLYKAEPKAQVKYLFVDCQVPRKMSMELF
jgi:hypothetical protein